MEAKHEAPGAEIAGYDLESRRLGGRQYLILGLTLLISVLDGYDALAMALTAPAVSRDWHLGKALLGVVLSSSLIGMAIGSIFLTPIADKVGRRPTLLGALAAMTAGSLMAALAPGPYVLAFGRFVTGIGIGAMIPMTTLFAAEFANARARPVVVAAIATVGFPVGGIIGGVLASAVMPTLGWHCIFLFGAIGGAILLVPAALALPESPAYLSSSGATDALPRINRVLRLLGHPALDALPEPRIRRRAASTYRMLFSPGLAPRVVRLTVINLLVASTTYYIINWLPQQITDLGFSVSTASSISAASHAVGMVGGLVAGVLATRFRATRLAGVMMIGCTVALVILGHAPPVRAMLLAAACLYGFCGVASTGLFYGILATTFPPLQRASGIGLVIGVGRAASAIAPAAAGLMFQEGFSRGTVSTMFACGPLIAALLIWRMPGDARRT